MLSVRIDEYDQIIMKRILSGMYTTATRSGHSMILDPGLYVYDDWYLSTDKPVKHL